MEENPIVIAHRGASGYLPEHTLVSKALAYAQGADYLEQDVVLTADNVPIVLHDKHLDTVTNVSEVFPDRKRSDGRYYAIDLKIAEVKKLRVHERINLKTGKRVFPSRFPTIKSEFMIPTLAEEIEFIQGLNKSSNRTVGIYPEIKAPAWHRAEGKDISRIVLKVLRQYGYVSKDDDIYLQCFDPIETRRIREELGCDLKVIQLIGENGWSDTDYEAMRTPQGLALIAQYADGIGPGMNHIVKLADDHKYHITTLVDQAHDLGLVVHPYTFRQDGLPKYATSYTHLMEIFFEEARVNGLFTDFPDLTVRYLKGK